MQRTFGTLLLATAGLLCLDCTGGQVELSASMTTSPWAPREMTSKLSVSGGRLDLDVSGCSDFALWGQVPTEATLLAPTP